MTLFLITFYLMFTASCTVSACRMLLDKDCYISFSEFIAIHGGISFVGATVVSVVTGIGGV